MSRHEAPSHVRIVLCLLAGLLVSSCGNIQIKAHDPEGAAGLAPVHEDKDAGLVGIAAGFNLKTYRAIVVERFSVTDRGINEDEDKKLAEMAPAYLQGELARRLRAAGLFDRVSEESEGQSLPADAKTLRLTGAITQLTGGSRHLRFWIGFGAGRSKVQTETRFIDAQSGQVVLVTADRRVGAMSEAASLDYGGSNADLVKESLNDMARDLAKFLVRLSQGRSSREPTCNGAASWWASPASPRVRS